MKVLFITWDSDQSNYLESLFFPIFEKLQEKGYAFHIVQFSWALPKEINRIAQLAEASKLKYDHIPVWKTSPAFLGVVLSLLRSKKKVRQVIQQNQIQLVMPRSTMPAWWCLMNLKWIKRKRIKLIFDADGLPIQERVDYAGLNPKGLIYHLLHNIELKILMNADRVITRTNTSINWHLQRQTDLPKEKFFKVTNGRDQGQFTIDLPSRSRIRQALKIKDEDCLLVHSGTLGKAYDLQPVFELMQRSPKVKLLILTRNTSLAEALVPVACRENTLIRSTSFTEIPSYLNAADVGICLRTKAPSLAGLAPIKLGEYLLCGLRVWVSPEIGDVKEELGSSSVVFFHDENKKEECLKWMMSFYEHDPQESRKLGLNGFAMESAIASYQKAFSR